MYNKVAAVTEKVAKQINDTPELRTQLLDKLYRLRKPMIATHRGRDGDAYGSQIALALFYKQIGASPVIYNEDQRYIPGPFRTIIEDNGLKMTQGNSKVRFDGLIILDTAERCLLPEEVESALDHIPLVYELDHHASKQGYVKPDHSLVSTEVSSTAELIYQLVPKHFLSADMALALHYGMLTDTGKGEYAIKQHTARIMTELARWTEVDADAIHKDLIGVTRQDEALVSRLLSMIQTTKVFIGKAQLSLAYTYIKPELIDSYEPGLHQYRKYLTMRIRENFATDLILTINPTKTSIRANLSANGHIANQINVLPVSSYFGDAAKGHKGVAVFEYRHPKINEPWSDFFAPIFDAIEQTVVMEKTEGIFYV